MITDARALRTDTVPQDLHHRDGQIDHLSAVLDPTGFDAPESVTIFGPSGAGKTTLAKYVLGQLGARRWTCGGGMWTVSRTPPRPPRCTA
ncbi:AAA family ATPase [Halomicroarcula sp. GCM10025709]|uniref:AAA family ATPase n=1 Tax=Halomicroarcula sp. GCM10025709 TaxID=3252669 RepID=UPI00360BE111